MMGRYSMGSQLTGDRVKKMSYGGKMKKMSYGGKMKKMSAGGKMSRGDGICTKGRTKGRMV